MAGLVDTVAVENEQLKLGLSVLAFPQRGTQTVRHWELGARLN